jgi:hypothetical protein
MKKLWFATLVVFSMVLPLSPPAVEAHHDAADGLKEDMRRLWTDHVVWTRVYRHILMMSDALSDGIVKQFPNKFGSGVASTTGKN